MSWAAKAGAIAAAFLTVALWAWFHGAFDGANLLAIVGLSAAIGALWLSLGQSAAEVERQTWSWTDRDQHRGDGV